MREIELATQEDLLRRVNSIAKSLEIIYQVKLSFEPEDIPLERAYPTEDFLENDKLAMVFKKTVEEGYDVPITAVSSNGDFFILDGHHRAFIRKKLEYAMIKACVLKFPEGKAYRNIPKRPLECMRIQDVSPIEDPILKAWQRILSVVKHYEAIYDVPFCLHETRVSLEDLVPTQPRVVRDQMEAIKEVRVPITCCSHGKKYYIIDGHARSLRAKELGLNSIKAMVLVPPRKMCFGIVKTAEELGLQSLEDVTVIEYFSHI